MAPSEEILSKARHFCSYQERCIKEVKAKLKAWKAREGEIEEVITRLRQEDFLNEERYAREFAGGKFRNNGWGRNKIRFELRKKNIPDHLITESLNALEDEEDIEESLLRILLKKSAEISAKNEYQKKQKLIQFALSRGFMMDTIMSVINNHKELLS